MNLKNDHNVYVLGAGFSCDAGLPLINDFLLRMRDSHEWLLSMGRKAEAEAVNKVLQFRLDAASAAYWVNLDLENIEELFSLAAANPGATADHIRLAIAATLDYSAAIRGPLTSRLLISNTKVFAARFHERPTWLVPHEIDSSVAHDAGRYTIGLYAFYLARLLGMFANGSPKGENTFITFNYDTLVEDALSELGLLACYGESSIVGGASTPGRQAPVSSGVPLLKLHGSINWASAGSAQRVGAYRKYSEVVSAGLVPELVPPTWKKAFDPQSDAVWEAAIRSLKSATRIIIIGFSIPPADMHFKYLLAAGLQNNISLREVLFVNPDESHEVELRAKTLLRESYIKSKRVRFEQSKLRNFLTSSQPSVLESIGRPAEHGMSFNLFPL